MVGYDVYVGDAEVGGDVYVGDAEVGCAHGDGSYFAGLDYWLTQSLVVC